ncbi:MAG TPA: helix-turn-helix transcriptional regulator, partial [Chloroflexota bacterium]|nr:helix-turn-helix transcriptional regulator [Chloroflexota bacterium]
EGETSRAAALAREAATAAACSGQAAIEAVAWHTLVRFGHIEQVPQRLRQLATTTDSTLVALFSAHAEALAADDGAALDRTAARLESAGVILHAAEAAAQAAAVHQRHGHRAAALASSAQARRLLQHCEGRTPALQHLEPLPLTRREREVAALAARGLTSRTIAERLVTSVRTVEGHLEQIYTKLGINSRAELAAALGHHPVEDPSRNG